MRLSATNVNTCTATLRCEWAVLELEAGENVNLIQYED